MGRQINHNKSEFQFRHGKSGTELICIVSEALFLLKSDLVRLDNQPNEQRSAP